MPSPRQLLRVFVPFAAGYFLSYLFRVVNAVISPDLVADLALGPADLGLLTATYFLTFAAFQLPLGVLLDRFGPRRVEALLLLFAAVGALIFAKAHSTVGLVAGRALIGFGVSACLMAAFTAFVMWFPAQRLPLVNGLQMAAGGLGALVATVPVHALLKITDWRGLFLTLSLLTFGAAAAVFFIVPEHRPEPGSHRWRDQLQGIGRVFRNAGFWRIAPLTVMSQSTFLSIQGLWSGPWLRDVAGLDRTAAADVLLLIAASMVAGFILLGLIAARCSRRGIEPVAVAVSGMGLFMLVQGTIIILNQASPIVMVWMLFGFFGSAGIISYSVLSRSFPKHMAGRANTALNLLVFVAAFAGQWGIGAVIGLWPTAADGGYAPAAYRTGFGMMLALQAAAMFWFAWATLHRCRLR
jgi:MFS family permease